MTAVMIVSPHVSVKRIPTHIKVTDEFADCARCNKGMKPSELAIKVLIGEDHHHFEHTSNCIPLRIRPG